MNYREMAERCISMLYVMCDGDEKADLNKDEFFRQCNQHRLFELPEQKFKQWKADHVLPIIVRIERDTCL